MPAAEFALAVESEYERTGEAWVHLLVESKELKKASKDAAPAREDDRGSQLSKASKSAPAKKGSEPPSPMSGGKGL